MRMEEQMPGKEKDQESIPHLQEIQSAKEVVSPEEFIKKVDIEEKSFIEDGNNGFKKTEETYKPRVDILEKHRNRMGVVLQKAKDLAEEFRNKIKGAVIGASMIMAATPALADTTALEKLAEKTPEGTKIENVQQDIAKHLDSNQKETVLYEAGESGNSIEEERMMRENASRLAKEVRQELITHYSSQDFLNKLIVEYGGEKERGEEMQSEMVKNLETVEVDTSLSWKELTSELKSKKSNANGVKDVFPMGGFDKKVTVPYDLDQKLKEVKTFIEQVTMFNGKKVTEEMRRDARDELKTSLKDVLRHELTHAASGEYGTMSKNAIKIFGESFAGKGIESDKYFSHPLEMLERKKTLDREMEKLGIKKYGEEFTEKHYEKVLDAYKKGLFSKDAIEFIKIIKQDPSAYKKILNEIAQRIIENNSKLAV